MAIFQRILEKFKRRTYKTIRSSTPRYVRLVVEILDQEKGTS